MRHRLWPSIAVLVLIVVAAAVVVTAALRRDGAAPPVDRSANAAQTGTSGATSDRRAELADARDRGEVVTTGLFRSIAQQQNPVVVAITTQSRVQSNDFAPFGADDFFRRFFGGVAPQPQEQLRRSLGSGFIIQPNGEIVTNNHVVAGAEQIRVVLYGNEQTTYSADVVGRDPLTDSALIRLKNPPANLPTATLGNSDALAPGDWVMAIGNPFELGHTVTVGVISYKGRPFATTEGRFQDMLQTDASINPGNSGGPLIDVHGQVIGINTAILAGEGSGGNVGIGFAVPINTVKDLLPQLRKGAVHRGRLGVQILSAPVTQDEAAELGLPSAKGAIVSRVEANSPADRAGLRAGDVIVEYNGKPVENANQLTSMVVNTPAGTRVPIAFFRDGRRQQATATIEELQLEDQGGTGGSERGGAPGFGLTLGDITPEMARQLRLPAGTQGAVVQSVEPFAPASNAGIRAGDVILEVNRQPVRSAREAADALRQIQAGKPAFLLLSRHGAEQFVEVRKE